MHPPQAEETSLMFAAAHGHVDVVRLLLERGADTNHAGTVSVALLMWPTDKINDIFINCYTT